MNFYGWFLSAFAHGNIGSLNVNKKSLSLQFSVTAVNMNCYVLLVLWEDLVDFVGTV
jgi:hypothetical protein